MDKVRVGDFVYDGRLNVDLGNGKLIPRAPFSQLKQLLVPGSNQKDETATFYEAQLIHYGLQRVKNKASAKLKLMDAQANFNLSIPKHIRNKEQQMKAIYESNLLQKLSSPSKKPSKTSDASGASSKSPTKKSTPAKPKPQKAAAAASSASNVNNITISFNGFPPQPDTSSKKRKRNDDAEATGKPRAKPKAAPKAKAPQKPKTSQSAPPPPKKQTARRTGGAPGPSRAIKQDSPGGTDWDELQYKFPGYELDAFDDPSLAF